MQLLHRVCSLSRRGQAHGMRSRPRRTCTCLHCDQLWLEHHRTNTFVATSSRKSIHSIVDCSLRCACWLRFPLWPAGADSFKPPAVSRSRSGPQPTLDTARLKLMDVVWWPHHTVAASTSPSRVSVVAVRDRTGPRGELVRQPPCNERQQDTNRQRESASYASSEQCIAQ